MGSSNAFETGYRKVIPAVLIYLENAQGQILMLHRNAKENDYHEGKWNGLGGKFEPDESPQEAASRELAEEAGVRLAPSAFRVLGLLQFPNFKAHKNEDWLVYVLTATLPTGLEAWSRGPEGELVWIDRDKILSLNLWEGDRHFIPLVTARRPFSGTLWYSGQNVVRAQIETF